ncbi:MAG TPA: hypothetical protein VE046_03565 [Steroidobacteraceae bacterium]|nr:hypothetical protein [Steroidobacteraceae bacterium]
MAGPIKPKTKVQAAPIDGFRRGHMTARFIAAALVIAPIVVSFMWRDPGHLEGSTRTSGTVVEYQKHIALLDLASGEQVRLYSGPNPVKAGDVLPLVADTYSNGTVQYRVDFKAMGVPAQ